MNNLIYKLSDKQEQILKDVKNMTQSETALKYNVSSAYVHRLAKIEKINEILVKFDVIQKLIDKGALKADPDLMTKQEIEFWTNEV